MMVVVRVCCVRGGSVFVVVGRCGRLLLFTLWAVVVSSCVLVVVVRRREAVNKHCLLFNTNT